MRINSVNSLSQGQSFSRTGSIGEIRLPDFEDKYTYTKNKSGISDAEFKKQIIEQAYGIHLMRRHNIRRR